MKYNDKEEKWIEIGFLQNEETTMAPQAPDEMGKTTKYLVGDNNGDLLGKPKLIFYVRDNGIGIREKHLDSVFRIFKRLHGRDKFGGGTGAGLTIVKKIIERHDGRIWVDSTFGEGTTFYFTLQGEKENGFERFHIEREELHPVG
jgi:signal transduction histidine kinase